MIEQIIRETTLKKESRQVLLDRIQGKRISLIDAFDIYTKTPLSVLGAVADYITQKIHNNKVYYNRNFHLEPTNICVYDCSFCSYSRKEGQQGSWDLSIEDMLEKVKQNASATEVHIVGGVHPERDVFYYADFLAKIKGLRPDIHVKAFTAVEIEFMSSKAGVEINEGLSILKKAGLNSIPGGGAEIFNDTIRETLCGRKANSKTWLKVHKHAHLNAIPSNATILYGHVENVEHRIQHLDKIRNLQDETGGFNAFIPLKYKHKDNFLSHLKELSLIEDLRMMAFCRLFLDNIPNLKAYWPMYGKETAYLMLSFGANDMDGTIEDSTRIYSMAGSEEQNPVLSVSEIVSELQRMGKKAVERDSLYNEL
ncbi:MAG: aminofutalosine synthase MqnE [Marinilabiliales bacterium]|nr:MAG: aminofutalosine synthase MqnE [Marinilabiliales bacterium]